MLCPIAISFKKESDGISSGSVPYRIIEFGVCMYTDFPEILTYIDVVVTVELGMG